MKCAYTEFYGDFEIFISKSSAYVDVSIHKIKRYIHMLKGIVILQCSCAESRMVIGEYV
jgi:hypothetical protein